VLLGHYHNYGVPLNVKVLQRFQKAVTRMWQRSLSRRSQKGAVTWERMQRYVARWIPKARIYHPYPDMRVWRDHPRQEPSAVVLRAGICAGGVRQQTSLPRTVGTGGIAM
jgi:RNA-directed DNA polymerase